MAKNYVFTHSITQLVWCPGNRSFRFGKYLLNMLLSKHWLVFCHCRPVSSPALHSSVTCRAPSLVHAHQKRKEEYLYSAILADTPLTNRSDRLQITQFYLQITPCLSYLRNIEPGWWQSLSVYTKLSLTSHKVSNCWPTVSNCRHI